MEYFPLLSASSLAFHCIHPEASFKSSVKRGRVRDLQILWKQVPIACPVQFVTLLRSHKIFVFVQFWGCVIHSHLYFHDLLVMTVIMQLAGRHGVTVLMILSTVGCLIVNGSHQEILQVNLFFPYCQ